jgi:hypothetical protein
MHPYLDILSASYCIWLVRVGTVLRKHWQKQTHYHPTKSYGPYRIDCY